MPSIPWSDKEVEALTKLIEAGYMVIDIMPVFPSRTREAIKCKMQNLGLFVKAVKSEIDMDRFNTLMKEKGVK